MSRADELHKWGCEYFVIPKGSVTAMLFHKYLRHLLDGESLEKKKYKRFKRVPSVEQYPFTPIDWEDILGEDANEIDAETMAVLTAIVNVYRNLYDNYENYTSTPDELLKKFRKKYPSIDWSNDPAEKTSVAEDLAQVVACNNELLRAAGHGAFVKLNFKDWEIVGCRIGYNKGGVIRAVELPHIYIKRLGEITLGGIPMHELKVRYGENRLDESFANDLLSQLTSSLDYPLVGYTERFVSGGQRESLRTRFIELLLNLYLYLGEDVAPRYPKVFSGYSRTRYCRLMLDAVGITEFSARQVADAMGRCLYKKPLRFSL